MPITSKDVFIPTFPGKVPGTSSNKHRKPDNLPNLTPAFFAPHMTDQILGQNISDNAVVPPILR